MQDSEKKPKHVKKDAEPVQQNTAPAEEAYEEYDLSVDDGEIPLRLKKNKKKTDKKAQKKRRKKASARARRRAASRRKTFSEKRFPQKRSLFELMSATGEDSFFKPITVFGKEIRFWPLFLLILIVMLIGIIVISNGNVKPVYEDITVVGLHDDLEGYNILVLSDMNGKRFGDEQGALTRQVESLDYDMILCVGDMVGEDGDPEPFYEFLDGLSRPGRVYFIGGDADPGPYVDTPRAIQGTLEQIVLEDWILGGIERGAHYVDVPTPVEIGETKLWLMPTNYLNLDATSYRDNWKDQMRQEEDGVVSGLMSDYNSLPATSYRYRQAEKFYAAISEIDPSDLVIALSHVVPTDDFIISAGEHDHEAGNFLMEPELIISGHYCGGVWQIPGLGAFYVNNPMLPRYGWFPDQEDAEGLSRVGECQVYITAGLSTTNTVKLLPFRLFNDPQISLLTLTAKLPDNMLEVE